MLPSSPASPARLRRARKRARNLGSLVGLAGGLLLGWTGAVLCEMAWIKILVGAEVKAALDDRFIVDDSSIRVGVGMPTPGKPDIAAANKDAGFCVGTVCSYGSVDTGSSSIDHVEYGWHSIEGNKEACMRPPFPSLICRGETAGSIWHVDVDGVISTCLCTKKTSRNQ